MPRCWDYRVTCYYGPAAEPPRQPGTLAIQTVHRGEPSMRFEVAAGLSRKDIGRVLIEVPFGAYGWTEHEVHHANP